MKKWLTYLIVFGLLLGLLYSFIYKRNFMTPANYFNWFNSKECTVSKWEKSGPMLFNLTYHSEDFMALSELNGERIDEGRFSNCLKNYECCEHFLLKIFSGDTISDALSYRILNEQEYYDRIQYLTAEFGNKTHLVIGNDTINCTFHHFERTYKLKPYISVNLIYEKKKQTGNEKMVLVIEPTIFNDKQINLSFESTDLDQIPQLKI